MKKLTFKSIKNQLTFWFLFIALTPLLISLIVTYIQRANAIETSTFDKIIAIRDLKVERLNQWLDETKGDLYVMSGDDEIRGLEHILEKRSKSAEDIEKINISRRLMKRNLKNFERYSEIFIIGVNTGVVEISTNPGELGENKSKDPYFSVPLETGEIYIKDIYHSHTTNRSEMTFSIPILCNTHNEHIIGILVARIDLQNSLYKILADKVGLGETGETLIVNKDVMALNELRWHENAPLNLKIATESAVDAANGKTGITITEDYRGEEILAAYTYIVETSWGFVCKQDLYELNEPIHDMIFNFVLLFVLSAFIIYFVAIFIGKSISKPIIGLDSVAKKIIAGDYSARNVIDSKDELGSLSESVNEMTESIESKITIQNGVSEISSTMIEQTSMQEFSSEILKRLIETTESNMGAFYILNELTSEFEHITSIGANEEMLKSFNSENPEGEFGNALSRKRIYHMRDIPEDTIFKFQTTAGDAIPKEIITIPILVDNVVLAFISLVNVNKFSKESYDILEQSWWSLNSSYTSLMANERTMVLAENLSKINQELEAKSEELQEQSEELQSQTEELQQTSEELQGQNLELEMQRRQVEQANKLKSEFLSNMSHELRTPLNSIMALSRVLIKQASDKLDEEENSYLEIVERNGKQLLNLINDILDLSKIEAGRMDLTPSIFSLDSEISFIKENLDSLAMEKDLGFHLNINGDIPKIKTDLAKFQQVLSNIIGNALKFTEKGEVNINVIADSERVYIEVEDTGIGIREDALPYIFEEFRQVDGSSSRLYEGTGLGLAIASKLINIIGGEIKVESESESGSKFTIILPIKWQGEIFYNDVETLRATSVLDKQSSLAGNNQEIVNELSDDLLKDPSALRLLMVDDNESAIIQIISILSPEGYKVDVARGGREAIDYIMNTIPDGIILDLMMPEIDGFEVLDKIKSRKETKYIPVLILTAKDLSKDDLTRLSANNIHQVIYKGSVDKEDLLFKIRIMLQSFPKEIKNENTQKNVETLAATPAIKKSTMSVLSDINKRLKPKRGLLDILVIEDNKDNMVTINAILKNKYNVIEASDGESGLIQAIENLPDIILLDMSLPKIDGVEVVRILKKTKATRGIPVIALTARAMKEDRDTFMDAGCDDYISKPIDHELILKKIEEWI